MEITGLKMTKIYNFRFLDNSNSFRDFPSTTDFNVVV